MKFRLWLLCLLFPLTSNAYWQQHVATTISVTLDDKNHFLRGFEKLVYTNNSPDTLQYIYIHLWANAYKNDRTQFSEQQIENGKTDFYFSKEKDRGFIDSVSFLIDGLPHDFDFVNGQIDIAKIALQSPLVPGQSITIETPFRVKIPLVFSRLGHNGHAYFISQWFPKPAVYDADGWHPMPYLDQGEFYSEYGSYDVTISLPKNYVVMATGNCQTAEEQNWMDSLASMPLPSDTLFRKGMPLSSSQFKTIRYTEDSVHDFAWFADKRWIVRKDVFEQTDIYTAFLPSHQKYWNDATEILQKTLGSYGRLVGKYPYKTIKALEGDMAAGGGMEYPTVTVIDKGVSSVLPSVLIHEAGHNWFYGILGTNERQHPWMDEGMNSFYEHRTAHFLKDSTAEHNVNVQEDYLYFQQVANNKDQPVSLAAQQFHQLNYGADVYYKSALLIAWLEQYMGKVAFKKGVNSYFETWKYKHPKPQDFRNMMQANTDKNLDWFFDGALYTQRSIDFKLKKVFKKDGKQWLTLNNNSDFAAPVLLSFYKKDTLKENICTAPFLGDTTFEVHVSSDFDKVVMSSDFADLRKANNEYRTNNLFHKGILDIGAGFGFNRKEVHRMYLAPIPSYNVYDGVSLGVLLHNLSYPQSRFQFAFAPQYSFGSKQVNGMAAFSYSWYPKKTFHEIRFQNNIKSYSKGKTDLNITEPLFARYFKIAPFVEFIFKEKNARSTVQQKLVLKQYNIREESFIYRQNLAVDSLYRPQKISQQNTYAVLQYTYRNARTFHPYSYNAEAQFGQSFIKLNLEGRLRIDYDIKDKSLYLRGFAGKFINTNTAANNNRYYLNTAFSGANDYLYDAMFVGRNENEGLWANQTVQQEGGFKLPTNLYANPLGRSDNWLLSLSAKTDLPFGKLPLRFYVDLATFADAKTINSSGAALLFNAGLELSLFKEAINIYAPLLLSKDYSDYVKSIYPKDRFFKSISFSINLQAFNGLRAHQYLFTELSK